VKINNYLIQLAITIMVLFGGTFLIHYIRTNDLLIDQLIGLCIGFLLLISAIVWRFLHKKR